MHDFTDVCHFIVKLALFKKLFLKTGRFDWLQTLGNIDLGLELHSLKKSALDQAIDFNIFFWLHCEM